MSASPSRRHSEYRHDPRDMPLTGEDHVRSLAAINSAMDRRPRSLILEQLEPIEQPVDPSLDLDFTL